VARHGRPTRIRWPLAIVVLIAAGVVAYFLFLRREGQPEGADNHTGRTTAQTNGGEVQPPRPAPPAEQRKAAEAALRQGLALQKEDNLLAARAKLSEAALSGALPPAEARQARQAAAELAERTIFGRELVADDPYCEAYEVQPGDLLGTLVEQKDLQIPWELLVRVNPNVPDEKHVPQRETIKLVRGPCHAIVYKSAFAMDLYLHRQGQPKVFLRRVPVGLGKDGSTPAGTWRVVPGEKLPEPDYEPAHGTTISYGQPGYPYGDLGLWIRIEPVEAAQTIPFGRYGIHSTSDPSSIGTESSGGCIRLRDEDMKLVWDLLAGGVSRVEVRK